MPRLQLIPFDSERKRMTVVRDRDGQPWAFVKGAPEVILARCSHIKTDNGVSELTDSNRARMLQTNTLMANEALRLLAVAERSLESLPSLETEDAVDADRIETNLTLLGLIGLQDPPRAEARAPFSVAVAPVFVRS